MLHAQIPDRVLHEDNDRLPTGIGILIAMGMSIALWGAIYAACVLRF